MAGFKKTVTEEKNETFSAKVTRATVTKNENRVCFDMTVNGIAISNCFMTIYTNKEGEENELINFPSTSFKNQKGEDVRKNYVWFPISKELRKDIRKQIEKALTE